MAKRPSVYVFEVTVEVRAEADSYDEALRMAQDCVLSGRNGCEAIVCESTLLEELRPE